MDVNAIWTQIEPYFIIVVTLLGGGGLTVFSVKSIINRLIQRLNVKAIVRGVVEGVATALIGGELNIDLTALTEQKITELTEKLANIVIKSIKEQSEKIDGIADLNVATADAITSLRALSDEQKERIREKSGKIRLGEPAPAKVVHKVKLEPVKVSEVEKSGISMG